MSKPSSLTALAAAKINIGWRVGGRRDDGYHEVTGLLQTIDLHDRVTIRVDASGPGFSLAVDGPYASPDLASDNLVQRAAHVMSDVSRDVTPVAVELHKNIPVGAGLGGGSADAAATMLALSVMWKWGGTAGELVELGAEVGSDVPAILLGGLVHASGRGEKVKRIGTSMETSFVLGVLGGRISAADAYRTFDEIGGIESRRLEANDLEPAARRLHDGVGRGLDAMRAAGASSVFVTGSGPTVVAATPDQSAAASIAARAAPAFAQVIVAAPSAWGVRVVLGGRH